jgi:hypothetical protein
MSQTLQILWPTSWLKVNRAWLPKRVYKTGDEAARSRYIRRVENQAGGSMSVAASAEMCLKLNT